jgi:hypothetical protein
VLERKEKREEERRKRIAAELRGSMLICCIYLLI